jgi:hypothetical protein
MYQTVGSRVVQIRYDERHEFYESKVAIPSGREERMGRIEERLGEMGVTLPYLPASLVLRSSLVINYREENETTEGAQRCPNR